MSRQYLMVSVNPYYKFDNNDFSCVAESLTKILLFTWGALVWCPLSMMNDLKCKLHQFT